MTSCFRDWVSGREDWTAEPWEYLELDDESVFVTVPSSGPDKSSGLSGGQLHQHGANVFQIRDGKVTTLVVYWYLDRALADLGLEE